MKYLLIVAALIAFCLVGVASADLKPSHERNTTHQCFECH